MLLCHQFCVTGVKYKKNVFQAAGNSDVDERPVFLLDVGPTTIGASLH